VDIYNAADIFVNPTLEDNFPTTNLEALACGTPVVTFDTGGSPESVDNSTGIVVEKNNHKQMRNEIYNIKQNPLNEFYLIERARYYYNKVDRYQEYLNLYSIFLIK